MSTTTTIRDIRKITGRIGAEVIGVDVTQPLAAETVTYLREALAEHKTLVFRGMPLDDAAQERFAASFGAVTGAHPTVASVEGAPRVLPVDSERGTANHWHTDVTFVHAPPRATTLPPTRWPCGTPPCSSCSTPPAPGWPNSPPWTWTTSRPAAASSG